MNECEPHPTSLGRLFCAGAESTDRPTDDHVTMEDWRQPNWLHNHVDGRPQTAFLPKWLPERVPHPFVLRLPSFRPVRRVVPRATPRRQATEMPPDDVLS